MISNIWCKSAKILIMYPRIPRIFDSWILRQFHESEDMNVKISTSSKKSKPNTVKLAQTTTCKMTTRLRQPILSPPKAIPVQSLLYKTTTCITWPAATFFVPQLKKTCLKQLLQNFIQQRNGKQCIKNKCLSDFIYSLWLYLLYCYFLMQNLSNIYKNWTFTFNIRLPNCCSC